MQMGKETKEEKSGDSNSSNSTQTLEVSDSILMFTIALTAVCNGRLFRRVGLPIVPVLTLIIESQTNKVHFYTVKLF